MDYSIIQNSLEYFDKNNEKYKNILKKAHNVKIVSSINDIEHSKIYIYDKNNNEIISSRYEIIGFYAPQYKMWNWAWAMPWLSKNSTYISRKILNYAFDILNINLKIELTTSRFRINNPIQLEIYSAIPSYLSKNPFIFKLIRNENNFDTEEFELIKEKDINNYENIQIQYLFILDY